MPALHPDSPKSAPSNAAVPKADPARIYRSLRLIRRAEELVAQIYPTDKIKSPVHLSIGQEATAVAVCDCLRPDDVVSGTYRSHAAYIAKGGDISQLFAELYGKGSGCARGRGGSMHLVNLQAGVLGTSAVVGTTVPIAAGWALALLREERSRVVVAFFGDGATEEGVLYETINFAALHRLPILFVCENNGYAIHTPLAKRWATHRLCERVESYGIRAVQMQDSDVMALRDAAAGALERIREGHGPEFIESLTYRWMEHVGPGQDFDAGYRSRDELAPWLARDPVADVGSKLPPTVRAEVDQEVEAAIAAAVDFAERSPFPEEADLLDFVYA